MQGVLFYTVVCSFALGVFIRSLYAVTLPYIVWIVLLGLVLVVLWRKKSTSAFALQLLCVGISLLAFSLGCIRMEFATQTTNTDPIRSIYNQEVTLVGTVAKEVDVREKSQHVYVQTASSRILVLVDSNEAVAYGDEVSVTGTVTEPESFETDLGREFDYEGYLAAKKVHAVMPFAEIVVLESAAGNFIIDWLLSFKYAFMERIELLILEPYAGLGEGLLLGVKQALGEELEASFRESGIMHIVVLSGYNIMLVVVFVMYVFATVLPYRLRLLCGGCVIVLFACMVGLSATVIRASAMAVLGLIAQATGRTYAVLRALFVTGTMMLLHNPYLLVYDIGFQLSFVATLGLIAFSPLLERYVQWMPTVLKLREFLIATVATQITVTPLLLYHIGSFSIVAIAVNLLVLPAVPVAMLTTFCAGILAFIYVPLAVPIAFIAQQFLTYIATIATIFASLPFASITVPILPFWIIACCYVLILCLYVFLYKLGSTSVSITESSVSSWTIVEEKTLLKNSSNASNNVPIFFR